VLGCFTIGGLERAYEGRHRVGLSVLLCCVECVGLSIGQQNNSKTTRGEEQCLKGVVKRTTDACSAMLTPSLSG
jgi:hypothetical protein